MKLRLHATLLGSALAAACAAPAPGGPAKANATSEPVQVDGGGAAEGGEGAPVEAGEAGAAEAALQPAAAPRRAQERRRRRSESLAVLPQGFWADPRFQARFRDSYLAVTDVEPPISFEERALLEEIVALTAAEDYEGALELLDEESGPQSSANFDFVRGNIGFQVDDLQLAIRGYQEAVNKFPRFQRAWKNLGLLQAREGEYELAADALTRVIALGGGDEITYGGLGAAYLSNSNPISAETAFRNAVMLQPEEEQWKLGLARAFFDQARYEEAAALCGTLIDRNPDRADFWLLQANAYLGLQQPLKAAENFEFVERLGASTADSMMLLGDIYTNQDLFDLANRAYARGFALADEPKTARVLQAGQRMIARESYDEAKRMLALVEGAFDGDLPEEVELEVLDLRARIAVAEGDDQADVAALERTVELDPLDGNALILLGDHRRRQQRFEEAEFLFDRAIALDEWEADASVAKAKLLVELERYGEAESLLKRANDLEPSQALEDYLTSVARMAKAR